MGGQDSVAWAAWAAAGSPVGHLDLPAGVCARCGRSGPRRATTAVVSKFFSSVDQWAHREEPGVCAACSWAYTTASLRRGVHLVDQVGPSSSWLERAAAAELLMAGPLPAHLALVVPLHPGRKHVLPHARWGQVAIEDLALPWQAPQAGLLRVVGDLCLAGVPAGRLADPVPPYQLLRAHPEHGALLWQGWAQLEDWRRPSVSPYLLLAQHVLAGVAQGVRRGA